MFQKTVKQRVSGIRLQLLATRSIKARARQEGRASLYDWIVYKRGSKARERKGEERKHHSKLYTILQSHTGNLPSRNGNLPLYNGKLRQSNGNLPVPFSTSAITLPPPLKKPALRLCISVLYPQGVLIYILNRQLIIFAILALYPLVQILQGSQLVRVLIEFFKLLGATYKVLGGVLGQVWIVTFPLNTVFQRSSYQFTGQYFINFPFIITINLNRQQRLILLSRQWVIYSFPQLIQ